MVEAFVIENQLLITLLFQERKSEFNKSRTVKECKLGGEAVDSLSVGRV